MHIEHISLGFADLTEILKLYLDKPPKELLEAISQSSNSESPTPKKLSASKQTRIGRDGGAVDWKKKYEEEFDKRSAIEEEYDNFQAQVF